MYLSVHVFPFAYLHVFLPVLQHPRQLALALFYCYFLSMKWTPAKSDLQKGLNGLHLADVGCDTVATSSRCSPSDGQEEPLVTPIYHSTTYKIPSVEHYLKILNSVCFTNKTMASNILSTAFCLYIDQLDDKRTHYLLVLCFIQLALMQGYFDNLHYFWKTFIFPP